MMIGTWAPFLPALGLLVAFVDLLVHPKAYQTARAKAAILITGALWFVVLPWLAARAWRRAAHDRLVADVADRLRTDPVLLAQLRQAGPNPMPPGMEGLAGRRDELWADGDWGNTL